MTGTAAADDMSLGGEEPRPAAARTSRSAIAGDLFLLAVATVVESLLLLACVVEVLPIGAALILHVAVIVALARRIAGLTRARSDTVPVLLPALLTACAGPLGAFVGLIGVLTLSRSHGVTPLLAAWYERLAQSTRPDAVTNLCDSIAIGRSLDLSAATPAAFAAVLESGSLGEKQAALGLIARAYHPAYLAALARALKSPEPVIRVQAAAVAARQRDAIAASLDAVLIRAAQGVDTSEALALIKEIDTVVGSGLVDRSLAGRGAATLVRLRDDLRARLTPAEAARHAAILATPGDPSTRAERLRLLRGLEAELSRDHRWAHLRAVGRAARLARSARLRIRHVEALRHSGRARGP